MPNPIAYIPASDRALYELVSDDPETRRGWGLAPMVGHEHRLYPTKLQAETDSAGPDLGEIVAWDLRIEPADQ